MANPVCQLAEVAVSQCPTAALHKCCKIPGGYLIVGWTPIRIGFLVSSFEIYHLHKKNPIEP